MIPEGADVRHRHVAVYGHRRVEPAAREARTGGPPAGIGRAIGECCGRTSKGTAEATFEALWTESDEMTTLMIEHGSW
jgi:hypothetical protein